MLTFDDMMGVEVSRMMTSPIYIFENRGKVLMYFMDGPLESSQIELFFESD